jgi:hypothetical protein
MRMAEVVEPVAEPADRRGGDRMVAFVEEHEAVHLPVVLLGVSVSYTSLWRCVAILWYGIIATPT